MLLQHKIQAGIAVSLIFLVFAGAGVLWNAQRNLETFRSVDHTHKVNNTLEEILEGVLNVETGNRGFAISGDELFLHPYRVGIDTVPRSLRAAKQLMQENPDQLRRLTELEPLIEGKIADAGKVIQLRRSGDTAGALQLISLEQGKQTMYDIRKLVAKIQTEENLLLPEIRTKAQVLASLTTGIVVFGGFLSLSMIGFASFFVRRDFQKRQEEEEEIRQFTAELKKLIAQRTAVLGEREAQLSEAQRIGQMGSWRLDLITNQLTWSDQVFRIFELAPKQFNATYDEFLQSIHPEDRKLVDNAYKESVRNHTPYVIEHRLLMSDGRIKFVQLRYETVYSANGSALSSSGTIQDISDRRRAEERDDSHLQKLHRLAELSLRLSGEPGSVFTKVVCMIAELFEVPIICLAEIVGKELRFNALWINGETFSDAGGCPLNISPCEAVETSKELHVFDRVQERFPQATFLRDHNVNAYCGCPSLDKQGNVIAVTCLMDTKSREFTEEDQEILRLVCQRVAVELEHGKNLAERKNMERLALRSQRMEAIGTLAGGVAHDLNNALAPIIMGVDLLRNRYPGESKIVDIFEASAKRGADMVRQLLTFAKGTEGERVTLHIKRLVKEMENLITGSFPKAIQLVVKCETELPTVQGDATQLHQILLNLCVNARDAMPQGGTLTLEVQRMDVDNSFAGIVPDAKPGIYVALRVRDTGTGIPQEIIDQIFDPFFTTKSPNEGTGLGLSTVMGIVKGHGGFLHVSSQLDQGSTFTAYLPASGEMDIDTGTPPDAAVEFHAQGESVLLVDDEASVREMAQAVLRDLNFKPLTAIDGADGLLQVARHRDDLRAIITDLHMPNMDGLTFVRALRRMLPDIPVVVASGRLEDAVAREFESLGVCCRLNKPFTQIQLAEALKSALATK
jgi:PAS domain S-box-containing protein